MGTSALQMRSGHFLERRVHDFDAAIDKLAAGDLRSEGASRAKDPQHLPPFTHTLYLLDCLGHGEMGISSDALRCYFTCFDCSGLHLIVSQILPNFVARSGNSLV